MTRLADFRARVGSEIILVARANFVGIDFDALLDVIQTDFDIIDPDLFGSAVTRALRQVMLFDITVGDLNIVRHRTVFDCSDLAGLVFQTGILLTGSGQNKRGRPNPGFELPHGAINSEFLLETER